MFYKTDANEHGLPHNPFKACIVPRPIGWISTVSADGVVNLAPYSFFNAVCADPPMVMFSSNGSGPVGPKDTRTNCEQTKEFVVNVATYDLREEINRTSAPFSPEVDELAYVGLSVAKSELVAPPRVERHPFISSVRTSKRSNCPGKNLITTR